MGHCKTQLSLSGHVFFSRGGNMAIFHIEIQFRSEKIGDHWGQSPGDGDLDVGKMMNR